MKERENYYDRHGIKTSYVIASIALFGLSMMFVISFFIWIGRMIWEHAF